MEDLEQAALERTLQNAAPKLAGRTFNIPQPKLPAALRLRRRFSFRNERFLHRATCSLTGKKILSIIPDGAGYKICDHEAWFDDGWDPLEWGRDYDFNRTFAEQYRELQKDVPHASLYVTNSENSYYTNYGLRLKNCYLTFGATDLEDCYYSRFLRDSKDCFEMLSASHCELCYEVIASQRCYESHYLINSRDCKYSAFLSDCESCTNCILCHGLYRKEYCILNKEVGKTKFEEYKKSLYPLTPSKIADLWRQFEALRLGQPHRGSHTYNCEDCSGDQIWDSKNCHFGFDVSKSEDSFYLHFMPKGISSFDCTYGAPDGVENCYNTISTVGSNSCAFTFMNWYCHDCYYSMECHNSSHLFGCVGIKRKQYCIFNKQYSKEDYEALVPKLIDAMSATGEWGEFFSPQNSYFGYNHTVAAEYFPLEKEDALALGFKWQEEEESKPAGDFHIPAENIDEVTDDICKKTLYCERTGKPYKIIPQELEFYRKARLPIPRNSPNQRHFDRIAKQNEVWQWPRTCAKTGVETWSCIPPESPYEVWSEKAFADWKR